MLELLFTFFMLFAVSEYEGRVPADYQFDDVTLQQDVVIEDGVAGDGGSSDPPPPPPPPPPTGG